MDETKSPQDVSLLKARLLQKMGGSAADYPVHIEQRFPRILSRISDLWGTPELDAYLEDLILPDRQGREGFPPEVAMELFHLASVHDALGLAPTSLGTGWASAEEVAWEKKGEIKGR